MYRMCMYRMQLMKFDLWFFFYAIDMTLLCQMESINRIQEWGSPSSIRMCTEQHDDPYYGGKIPGSNQMFICFVKICFEVWVFLCIIFMYSQTRNYSRSSFYSTSSAWFEARYSLRLRKTFVYA